MRGEDEWRSTLNVLAQTFLHELVAAGAVTSLVKTLFATHAMAKGTSKAKQTVRFGLRWAITGAAAALLFISGGGFLLAAAYMVLAVELGDMWAGVALGSGLWLLLAVVIVAGQKWAMHEQPDPIVENGDSAGATFKWLSEAFCELKKTAGENPLPFMAVALIIGLLISERGSASSAHHRTGEAKS